MSRCSKASDATTVIQKSLSIVIQETQLRGDVGPQGSNILFPAMNCIQISLEVLSNYVSWCLFFNLLWMAWHEQLRTSAAYGQDNHIDRSKFNSERKPSRCIAIAFLNADVE